MAIKFSRVAAESGNELEGVSRVYIIGCLVFNTRDMKGCSDKCCTAGVTKQKTCGGRSHWFYLLNDMVDPFLFRQI